VGREWGGVEEEVIGFGPGLFRRCQGGRRWKSLKVYSCLLFMYIFLNNYF